MLSSQQRLLFRVARRRIPSRNALLSLRNTQQHQENASLAAFSTFPSSFPSSRNPDDKSTTRGLPVLGGKNALLSRAVLERAYPLGITRKTSPVLWFSTATKTEEEKKSIGERASEYRSKAKAGASSFGGMMKKYGPTFLYTYLGVYATNLTLFYFGIESGVLDPVTFLGYITGNHEEARSSAEVVAELMEHYTITAPFAETAQAKPHVANFAIAWIATKFTEPIRAGASIAIVPTVARYFGRVPKEDDSEEDASEKHPEEAEKKEETPKTEEEPKTEEKKP